ncbi:transcriptional regulator, TetR family [Halopseudomonas xinjiangensis]|uniref:Transcriptional regulator, TetR family n=1 Tax=Halopseudomonas xinjiangensis TaxID=487184 RepID=A0A1H1WI56_9GAMM|nr:TetR family transcriptional regulator [Halopseudomonas xinjiangensis]SDS96281.1 transcriptional regulator, TetR family [Halopseudomonas xinjiangensis]
MRRTKEDAEKTRLKIIEAALTLFSRNGYSNTTLAMIGTEAGFSRGPIYWHFKNKDDLYQAVLAYSQEPLERLILEAANRSNQPLEAVERFAADWLTLLTDDAWFRQSFEILLNKTELTEAVGLILVRERQLTENMIDTLASLFATAQQQGLISMTLAAKRLGLLTYTYLMGITQSWLFAPGLFDLEEERTFFTERLSTMVRHA